MAAVQTVTIDFAVEAAKLRSELDQVKRRIGDLDGSIGSISKSFGALGGALAGIVSAGGILGVVSQAVAAADALGDLASRAGETVETMSRLSFIANQNDVSLETLSKSVKTLLVNLSSAGDEGSKASDALALIGQSAQQLKALGLEDQIFAIADGFQRLGTNAEQASVAQALFGKTGFDLLPALRQGGDALRDMADNAQRLGATLTTEGVAGLGAYERAWKQLKDTVNATISEVLGRTAFAVLDVQLTKFEALEVKIAETRRALESLQNPASSGRFTTDELAAGLAELSAQDEQRINNLKTQLADLLKQRTVMLELEDTSRRMNAAFESAAAGLSRLSEKAAKNAANSKDLDKVALDAQFLVQLNKETSAQIAADTRAALDAFTLETTDSTAETESEIARRDNKRRLADFEEFERNRLLIKEGYVFQQIALDQLQGQSAVTIFQGTLSLIASFSKKGAKIQQKVKIAETIWSTAAAIMRAYAELGPIYGTVAAVFLAAQGIAQIKRIKQATPDGSGGGSFGGVGGGGFGGTDSFAEQPLPEAQGATQRQAVNVYVQGNNIAGPDSLRWVIDGIADLVNSADYIIFNGESRQAQELRGG